jgi:hypothetical protein
MNPQEPTLDAVVNMAFAADATRVHEWNGVQSNALTMFDDEQLMAFVSKVLEARTELLETLQDVAQVLAWVHLGESRGFSDRYLLTANEALEKARAAIAKATGAA